MTDNLKHHKPEVQSYLERIGYTGSLDGSPEALAELQECHLRSVPYENFDILRGIPISLDTADLLDKIVNRRRGGYCFELNALFGWLLREAGYSVEDYQARFWRGETQLPPKRRHQVLKVKAGGANYLCDVGVGTGIPKRPLLIQEGLEQSQNGECYRLELDSYFGWVLSERKEGEWFRIFSFTEEPQLPKDFIMPSYWCEHAPDSIFTKAPMVSVQTKEGRNTIAGQEFRIFTAEGVRTFIPEMESDFNEALFTYFGLKLDAR